MPSGDSKLQKDQIEDIRKWVKMSVMAILGIMVAAIILYSQQETKNLASHFTLGFGFTATVATLVVNYLLYTM